MDDRISHIHIILVTEGEPEIMDPYDENNEWEAIMATATIPGLQ